jgi:hypothetical protein
MLENIIISKHAEAQMKIRAIPVEVVKQTLEHPVSVFIEEGKKIYQAIVNFSGKNYLVRVFVNTMVQPNVVITVYRTSKIEKYNEDKI